MVDATVANIIHCSFKLSWFCICRLVLPNVIDLLEVKPERRVRGRAVRRKMNIRRRWVDSMSMQVKPILVTVDRR